VRRHRRTSKKKVRAFFPGNVKTYGIARCMIECWASPFPIHGHRPTNQLWRYSMPRHFVGSVSFICTKHKKRFFRKISTGSVCPRDHTVLPTGVESSAGTACRQVVPSSFRKGLQCGSDRMSAPFQKFKDDRVRKRSSLLESKVTMTDSGGKNVATAHARWQQKPQHTYRLLARKSYHVKMVAAAG
jgi:hypothetical protein